MSWIAERLNQRQQNESSLAVVKETPSHAQSPRSASLWDQVCDAICRDVSEFNERVGSQQFIVQPPKVLALLQVGPGRDSNRVATAVLELTNKDSGEMKLTCPPEGSGINRHGKFRVHQGMIEVLPDFVGKGPSGRMTPPDFSQFVLDPLLFPDLQ